MIDYKSFGRIFLFRDLDEKELKLVHGLLKKRSVPANKKVVQEGKPGESLFIILSGKVRVIREFDGEPFSLTELGPYDFFGEISLIDDFPASATVETLEKTILLMITRADFKKLISENSKLSSKLWQSIARSLAMRIRKTGDVAKMYYALNKALCESSSW